MAQNFLLMAALVGWGLSVVWLLWLHLDDLTRERNFYRDELHARVGVRALSVPVKAKPAAVTEPVKEEMPPLAMYIQMQRQWSNTDWELYEEYNRVEASALPKDDVAKFEAWVERYGSTRPGEVFTLGGGMM